jgi:hypothetical protein
VHLLAQVVMLFGEIDCREGLIQAVERLKYETLEQAAEAAAEVYLKVLLDLVTTRHLEVFVHPIPPVLDATRGIVKLCNAIFKCKVTLLGGVHWCCSA